MIKNAFVFRLDAAPTAAGAAAATVVLPEPPTWTERLDAARFVPCTAAQAESQGWSPPRRRRPPAAAAAAAVPKPSGRPPDRRRPDDGRPLVERVGRHHWLAWAVEQRVVPPSVLRAEVDDRVERVERETGRRPRGKALRELRDDVLQALLPRAFAVRRETPVWIDPDGGWAVVGVASLARADAVLSALAALLGDGVRLRPLRTARLPVAAMASWLLAREAPPGFTIDRDCELRQPDGEHASVRYAHHPLDIDEVPGHVRAGKLPRQLGLTWQGRVSLSLHDSGALRRIDVLRGARADAAADSRGDDDPFDGDAALVTGELARLLPALVDALGGFAPDAAGAAPNASATAGATPPAPSSPLPLPALTPAQRPAPSTAPAPAASVPLPTGAAPWDDIPE